MAERFNESKSGSNQVAWESAELIVELPYLPVTIITNLLKDIFGGGEK